MNDLDICKRMARIEGVNYTVCINAKLYPSRNAIYFREYEGNRPAPTESKKLKEYNPLTDDDLCFKLMIKYSVNLNIQDTSRQNVLHKYIACVDDFGVGIDKTSPNKAICLAIIEANKGK